jgi:hypothetical protein
MHDGIKPFYSADGRHKYQRVGWQDGRIVWQMWSSWRKSAGAIDWVIVRTDTLPKRATRADVARKLNETRTA